MRLNSASKEYQISCHSIIPLLLHLQPTTNIPKLQKRRKWRQQRFRFKDQPLRAGGPLLANPLEAPSKGLDLQRGPPRARRVGLAEDAQEEVLQLPRAARIWPGLGVHEELVQRGHRPEEACREAGRRDRTATAVHLPLFRGVVEEAAPTTLQRDRNCLERHHETDHGQESRGGAPGEK